MPHIGMYISKGSINYSYKQDDESVTLPMTHIICTESFPFADFTVYFDPRVVSREQAEKIAYDRSYNTISYLMRNLRPLSEAPEWVQALVESDLLNENDESSSDVPDDEEEKDDQ